MLGNRLILTILAPAIALSLACIRANCESEQQRSTDTPKQTPKTGYFLRGSVEHQESMPAVQDDLQPGKTYQEANVEQVIPADKWYRVPDWLAGDWHNDTRTNYYWQDLTTGDIDHSVKDIVSRGDETIGWQPDRDGNIWQYQSAPYSHRTEGEDTYVVHQIKSYEPVEMQENKFVDRSVSVQINVKRRTGKILWVAQVEQLHIYTPMSPTEVRREDSSKVFDMNGQPLRLEKAYEIETQTTKFRPVNFYHGKNVKQLFADWLATNGMNDLIPAQTANN